MSSEHTHYNNLRVTRNASAAIVKAAYRALCMEYHPDKNPGRDTTRIMQIINEAYEVLSDPAKRAAYDAKLKAQEAASGGDAQRRQQEQEAREEAARAKREQEAREREAAEASEAAAKTKAQEAAKRNTTKQPRDVAGRIGLAVAGVTIVGMILVSVQQPPKRADQGGATMVVPAPSSDRSSANTVAVPAPSSFAVQAIPTWHWIASEPEADGRLGSYFSNLKCTELGKKSFGYMVQYGDHGVEQRGCWNVSKGPDGVVMRVVYPRAAENESQGANRTWASTDVVWLSEARAGLAGYKIPDHVRTVYDAVEQEAKAASGAAARLASAAEAAKPEPVAMSRNSWKYLSSDRGHHFSILYATNKLSIDDVGVHALVLVAFDSMLKNTAGVERRYETGLVDINCASSTYVSGIWENFDNAWVKVGDTGHEGSQRSFAGVGAVGDALLEICRVAGKR